MVGEGEVKHRSSVEHRYTGNLTLYLGNMWGVTGEGVHLDWLRVNQQ